MTNPPNQSSTKALLDDELIFEYEADVLANGREFARAKLLTTLESLVQKAVTEARLADKQMLVSELREYYKKYPEADFMDISGYIVGFYARPTLKNQDRE